ncbi:InlB B-repeat-containing protein [Bacillus horti]|uniref:Repeat protein (TIGR02543 family) n=1 Tax=Caldalkalibacillus horti TaxID=77523 RepID=A0ABT9W359_9BACI|nr:InlB B-repeat-containing protein [Bacillus horti]MDQ0167280.1 putative repeat protein (TIGR02543 family) [Bacillus horti]
MDSLFKRKWWVVGFLVCMLVLAGAVFGVLLQEGHASAIPDGDPLVIDVHVDMAPSVKPNGARIDCYPECPTIQWGDYTYWIYGEVNSNQYFFVTAYNSANELLGYKMYHGDRYIISASVDTEQRTISLHGQRTLDGINPITFPWDELIPVISFDLEVDSNPIFDEEAALVTAKFNGTGDSSINAVDFYVGNAKQNATPIPLSGGDASFSITGLGRDTHIITAHLLRNNSELVSVSNPIFLEVRARTVTVSFESNGGTAVPDREVEINSRIQPAPIPPSRNGYTFRGWFKEEALQDEWIFFTDTVQSTNMTLYAKWEANNYMIRFNVDGLIDTWMYGQYGTLISAPASPTKVGYTFGGWYRDPQYTNQWDFAIDTVPATDITLYAKWVVNEYTIRFNVDDEEYETSTGGYGTLISEPNSPAKTGYTFRGWYKDDQFGDIWDFTSDTVPARDIILYAGWEVNEYTITFEVDGSEYTTITADYGTLISPPASPTKQGYLFRGWYKDDQLTEEWDIATDTVPAIGFTLYGKWEVRPPSGGNDDHYDNPQVPIQSSNAELSKLTFSLGVLKPIFSSNIFNYTLEVGDDVESIMINPSLAHHKASMTVNGKAIPKEGLVIDLKAGKNTIKIVIRSENSTQQTYTIEVVRESNQKCGSESPAFSDLTDGTAAIIQDLVCEGILKGYTDGTFKPNHPVTRAEFTVMLANAFQWEKSTRELTFTDYQSIGEWAKLAITSAMQKGIFFGYEDGSFRPHNQVTRAEMAVIIMRALDLTLEDSRASSFEDDADIQNWAKAAVEAIRKYEIWSEDNAYFRPKAPLTRMEAAIVISRILELE